MLNSDRLKRLRNLILVILFWLVAWQAASMIVNQSLFMPSPYETFVSLSGLIVTGDFWVSIAFTFYRVVFGLAVSFVLGIALAFAASRLPLLETLLRPAIAAAKATPVMSIIILALVYFSSSFVPVFSCILLCFPIFYANTLAGIKSVDKNLLELADVFYIRKKTRYQRHHHAIGPAVCLFGVVRLPRFFVEIGRCGGSAFKPKILDGL